MSYYIKTGFLNHSNIVFRLINWIIICFSYWDNIIKLSVSITFLSATFLGKRSDLRDDILCFSFVLYQL